MIKQRTSRLIAVAGVAFAVLMSACGVKDEMKDGYQFGDVSKGLLRDAAVVMEKRGAYCAMAEDNPLRAVALIAIRVYLPLMPADGVCGPELDTLEGVVAILAINSPLAAPKDSN